MKKISYILFTFCLFITTTLVAQTQLIEARKMSRQGAAALDSSDFATALRYFKAAQQLDSANITYRYQIATVHFLKNDFKQSLKVALPLLTHRDVSPSVIRLIANNYDNLKQQDKAIDIYKKGIELAPNDGKFYHDLGTIYLMRKQPDLAAEFFEKGIEMDNKFSSNYYWACKSLLATNNYWWGVLYGELFLNMERNTTRTYEISKLLYDSYYKVSKIGSDSLLKWQVNSQKWETKFEVVSQEIWNKISVKPQKIHIVSLAGLRRGFLQNYFANTTNKTQNFLLLDFWKEIDDNDYWEAYNFWLFNQGNEPEFEEWLDKHAPSFGRFITWFVQHPMEVENRKVTRK